MRFWLSLMCSCLLFASTLAQTTVSGDIESTITDIVATIPGNGSNSFVIPSTAQMNVFASVFSQMNAGTFSNVASLLSPYGYTITKFYNTPTKDTLYLVKESLPLKYGWGTFVYNPKSTNDLSIEIPHPLWDKYTWSMGIKVYLGAKAKWYILAGTHRYANSDTSSDMAHVTASMFYTAHVTNANAVAVQCHGFDGSSSTYTGYPDAVISCGTLYPSTIYYTLRDKYVAQGFDVGVFSYSTYSALYNLGAQTNTEGKWSNSNNKKFVHIEHDQPLRYDTTNMRKCVNAIVSVFGLTTGVQDEPLHKTSYNIIKAFPNPFNPSTTISVELAQAGESEITVTDLMGRKVQELFKGYMAAGTHTIKFNAGTLASGVYFCTLRSHNTLINTKLILLK
jgi:uncharacterized membrane protein